MIPARIVALQLSARMAMRGEDDPFAITEVRTFWPRAVASRIISQSGLFTVHCNPNQPWQEPFQSTANIFDIPGEARGYFQRRLYYLGIHDHMIKGGLDGLGARLSWQYLARTGLQVTQ